MGGHRKITSTERDKIAYWHAIGESIREIARRLGKSPSSISQELRRNRIEDVYHSIHAHKASVARKQNSHKKYLLKTRSPLRTYVLEKLGLGWSPEQIAGRLRKEITAGTRSPDEYINHESIYQYIYDAEQKDLRLWELLPRSHRKRFRWLGRRSLSAKVPLRVSIRERPEDVNRRVAFGHWEGDTIVGSRRKTGIHTEVERVSRLLFAQLIPKIQAKDTARAQLCIFNGIPREARKSTTLDNGVENYLHMQLTTELGMHTYFADPYSSWQRGTNEYTNSLLRRYFPKKTDFRDISQEEVNAVVDRLNNTPRKVLGYHTPLEVFGAYLLQRIRTDKRAPFTEEHGSDDTCLPAMLREPALFQEVV